MMVADNRQVSRVKTEFPVTIQIDSACNSWPARATNISVNGMCICTGWPLSLNVPFVVHFPCDWPRAFAIAKAVYRKGDFYGCQFIYLPPKVYQALDCILAKHLSARSPKALHTLWETL